MRKLVYFINPISGTKNKGALPALIEKRTRAAGFTCEIMHTNAQGQYEFLIDKIFAEKITDIIVCGGDGTVNQLASVLQGIKVNIGIVPMGSGNGLALAAGISRVADKALDIIFKGNASFVDGFYINSHFSCMLCGLGFDAQVAHDFASQNTRGLATYIQQTVKNFFTAHSYPFVLHINGKKLEADAFFISIANSNQFGNNVTIAPRASIADGLIDIVVVGKTNKLRMLYTVFNQVSFGKVMPVSRSKFQKANVQYYQCKELVIENPALAPLHIDGDPAKTSERFEIKIKEKAFMLLQP
ncbi:MAG: diacylglycerol kinase family protein [Ferruginibacter sp.]